MLKKIPLYFLCLSAFTSAFASQPAELKSTAPTLSHTNEAVKAVEKERTLAILKPDSIEKRHIGKILAKIEKEGFKIVALKMTQLSQERAQSFYGEHQGKAFFPRLVAYMTRGPIVVAVLESKDAVQKNRRLIGATDPKKAEKGTIRFEFASSLTENAIHSSDSKESAAKEIAFFFSEEELFPLFP